LRHGAMRAWRPRPGGSSHAHPRAPPPPSVWNRAGSNAGEAFVRGTRCHMVPTLGVRRDRRRKRSNLRMTMIPQNRACGRPDAVRPVAGGGGPLVFQDRPTEGRGPRRGWPNCSIQATRCQRSTACAAASFRFRRGRGRTSGSIAASDPAGGIVARVAPRRQPESSTLRLPCAAGGLEFPGRHARCILACPSGDPLRGGVP
jgi:hypothetical protein